MSLPPPRPTLFPYTTLFRSKGVLYTHRGAYLSALGNTQHYRLDGASKYLWTLPMFHCNGWTMTWGATATARSEEHTSELQSRGHLVCRLLLEKKIHNNRVKR